MLGRVICDARGRAQGLVVHPSQELGTIPPALVDRRVFGVKFALSLSLFF